jgi:hypothetical protein
LSKESKVVGGNLDAKPGSAALGDFDGASFAALDLVQHGLAGDAEAFGGLGEGDEAVGDVGDEARADLVGQADAPGCVGGGLLAGQQPVPEPAADRERRDAELLGGVLDRDELGVWVWRGRGGDAGAKARLARARG